MVVNEFSQTSVPSIWAIGDVTERINLTPVALMEGMALAKTIALNQPTKPDYHCVPSAVFSNPPIATVVSSNAAAPLGLALPLLSYRMTRAASQSAHGYYWLLVLCTSDGSLAQLCNQWYYHVV